MHIRDAEPKEPAAYSLPLPAPWEADRVGA
jgi:hypothetical protein